MISSIIRCFVIQLIILPVYAFPAPQKLTNLLEIKDATSIKPEESLSFSFVNGGDLLIECSGAPTRTPAVFFGTIKVTPGEKYTYVLNGIGHFYNGGVLYVTTPKGNLVWPGSAIRNGIAKNTFIVPADVSEISVGLVFMYPSADDSVLINDVGLFFGDIDTLTWTNPNEKRFSHLVKNESLNLINPQDISLFAEKGVEFAYTTYEESPYLIVRSTGVNTVSPSIRFTTVKVQPGQTYSFVVKAKRISPTNMSLYVMSPTQNVVWPGNQITNGFAKNAFQIPPDVNEITLAMAFVYPKNNEYVLIQDIGLFRGDLDPEILDREKSDSTGIRPLINAKASKGSKWKKYALLVDLLLVIPLFWIYRRRYKKIPI